MPDHSFTAPEEVQYIGQTPDEIGQQFDALALREAEATRIALECRVKRAKLHRQSLEQHGFKGKQYVEFVSQHGGASRTERTTCCCWRKPPTMCWRHRTPRTIHTTSFRTGEPCGAKSKPATRRPKTDIGSRRQKPKRSSARRSAISTIHFLSVS